MKRVLFAVLFVAVSRVSFAQTNTNGGMSAQQWPQNPPVGIGTEGSGGVLGSGLSLQIHHDPSMLINTQPAVLRLSDGGSTSSTKFGVLGLMPTHTITAYSSLTSLNDLILHEHDHGDIILTNFWPRGAPTAQLGGAIRLATAGDTGHEPDPSTAFVRKTDYERLTVDVFGNIGLDAAPDPVTGLVIPRDQVEIGGGAQDATGSHLPGLTIYGGNRYEGLTRRGSAGPYPIDWRYLSLNHYQDHFTGVSSRLDSTGSSGVYFGDGDGGMVSLITSPWYSGDPLTQFGHGMTLNLQSSNGLSLWADQRRSGGIEFHHLFDVWRPDSTKAGDSAGMFFHHTPVYIGTHWYNWASTFYGMSSFHPQPAMGGTWILAVDGPALFKEAYVNTPDWPDFVFDASYKLPPLPEVGNTFARITIFPAFLLRRN